MADLYAIGDLGIGDTSDDLLSYASDVLDPFGVSQGVADAMTNGGGSADDGSGSVPLGEGDGSAGGSTVLASGSVAGGASPFTITGDSSGDVSASSAVQQALAYSGGNLSPGVVSGGGNAAPTVIGPGTTTPTTTGTPWVKYGIGALAVAALAYFGWKWMNKRPKRANPKKRRKARR